MLFQSTLRRRCCCCSRRSHRISRLVSVQVALVSRMMIQQIRRTKHTIHTREEFVHQKNGSYRRASRVAGTLPLCRHSLARLSGECAFWHGEGWRGQKVLDTYLFFWVRARPAAESADDRRHNARARLIIKPSSRARGCARPCRRQRVGSHSAHTRTRKLEGESGLFLWCAHLC